jgi:DNA-binding NtrC family response regulator
VPRDYDADSIATTRQKRAPAPPARAIRITVVSCPGAAQGGTFAQGTVTVGRSPAADLALSDPEVSSFHAEVASAEGGFRVRDLASSNGTYYEGARLVDAIVGPGSPITIGRTVLRLDWDAPFVTAESEGGSHWGLEGESHPMRAIFAVLDRIAKTDLSVLVEGPTGTGKELVALAIHQQSRHSRAPFVVLDCTAIPATLAESILYGHEKGAFTGATERRAGIFETAGAGTVFLDEVGELPIDLQPKLLRVLEQRQVVRLGGTSPIPVRARVVSATWRDLRALINIERFREDLYYRLAHARLNVPSLRDRPEDIPVLVRHFLRTLPDAVPCARAIAPDALEELARRDYPGNVRELKHTVERAAMMAAGSVVTVADLAFERMLVGHRERASKAKALGTSSGGGDEEISRFKEAKRSVVEEFERGYLARLLTKTGGNLTRASSLAGIERHHLRDLARKYGLRAKDEA